MYTFYTDYNGDLVYTNLCTVSIHILLIQCLHHLYRGLHHSALLWSSLHTIFTTVSTPLCSAMIQPAHHLYYSEYTSPLWYDPVCIPALLQWVHHSALMWSCVHTSFTTVSTLLIKHAQCTSLIQRAHHLYYSEYITNPAYPEYITDPACTPALLQGVNH